MTLTDKRCIRCKTVLHDDEDGKCWKGCDVGLEEAPRPVEDPEPSTSPAFALSFLRGQAGPAHGALWDDPNYRMLDPGYIFPAKPSALSSTDALFKWMGKHRVALTRWQNDWAAYTTTIEHEVPICYGATPEEALRKLAERLGVEL